MRASIGLVPLPLFLHWCFLPSIGEYPSVQASVWCHYHHVSIGVFYRALENTPALCGSSLTLSPFLQQLYSFISKCRMATFLKQELDVDWNQNSLK